MNSANQSDSSEDYLKQYVKQVKRTIISLIVFAVFVLVIINFMQVNKQIIYGFLWGVLTSIIYYIFIVVRVRKIVDLEPIAAQRVMGVGAILRFFLIAMMLIIAIKVPQIDFLAAVGGLFSFHIVMILDALIVAFKQKLDKR